MKQAVLITAYKNPEFIFQIIDALDDDFSFYIHFDRKKKYDAKVIKELQENKRVKFISFKYKVNWGSVKHLEAILHLAEEAVKDAETEYFHLITGQDYPIKHSQNISEYLEQHKGKEFITGDRLPAKKWKEGGLNRISYYAPYEIFNGRGYGRFPIKTLVYLQKAFRIKRKMPDALPILYGGSTYWTLSKQAVRYVLDFLKENPSLMKRLKQTFCAEEILFQSILYNSPFEQNIVRDNMRFIVWQTRDGQNPANLDERDYEAINASKAFFARKFEKSISDKLLKKIQTL
ncbi:MAG: beta-1,6-N-acetylglucosaminyltransferase [Dysgonomonas sp.]